MNCPYCQEDIKKYAVKCKHCGEFLDGCSPEKPVAHQIRDTQITSGTTGGQLFWIIVAAIVVGGLVLVIG